MDLNTNEILLDYYYSFWYALHVYSMWVNRAPAGNYHNGW